MLKVNMQDGCSHKVSKVHMKLTNLKVTQALFPQKNRTPLNLENLLGKTKFSVCVTEQ